MAKKNPPVVIGSRTEVSTEVMRFQVAPMVGQPLRKQDIPTIPSKDLPQEFQNQEFEVLNTMFAPTARWNQVGQFVMGVFKGRIEDVGDLESNLYEFEYKGFRFGVWGSTVLDRALSHALETQLLERGDFVRIIYIGDAEAKEKGLNPCKLFRIDVMKPKK